MPKKGRREGVLASKLRFPETSFFRCTGPLSQEWACRCVQCKTGSCQECEYKECGTKVNCTTPVRTKKKVLMESQSMRNKAYKVAKSIHKNFSRLSALGLVVLETVSLSDGTKITSDEHGVFQSLLIPLSDAELLFFP